MEMGERLAGSGVKFFLFVGNDYAGYVYDGYQLQGVRTIFPPQYFLHDYFRGPRKKRCDRSSHRFEMMVYSITALNSENPSMGW